MLVIAVVFLSLALLCLGLYSKRPEWTQPENLDALFIGISEIVDKRDLVVVASSSRCF